MDLAMELREATPGAKLGKCPEMMRKILWIEAMIFKYQQQNNTEGQPFVDHFPLERRFSHGFPPFSGL